MAINKLVLTKEELPILHDICFQIPIHPKLFDPSLQLNPLIAREIFPQVAEEWQDELKNKFPSGWEDGIQVDDNGFVTGFSISRDYGGALYFDKSDRHCTSLIPTRMIAFSEDKVKEFEYKKLKDYSLSFVYASHNINDYPGALFLRNWVIKYMNEVLQELS
jgi:hypothetical protein